MKEHIKLLAEQAGLGQERWTTTEQFNSFLEKFSELIIQECITSLDQQYVTISDDADPEDNKIWISAIMNTTVARCKHSILSNFGVEE